MCVYIIFSVNIILYRKQYLGQILVERKGGWERIENERILKEHSWERIFWEKIEEEKMNLVYRMHSINGQNWNLVIHKIVICLVFSLSLSTNVSLIFSLTSGFHTTSGIFIVYYRDVFVVEEYWACERMIMFAISFWLLSIIFIYPIFSLSSLYLPIIFPIFLPKIFLSSQYWLHWVRE